MLKWLGYFHHDWNRRKQVRILNESLMDLSKYGAMMAGILRRPALFTIALFRKNNHASSCA
jgi:hypothetical protein